ncbi:hypothetical protein VNO77_14925 [Canavalia gladiata]|uniref:Uncharacterized protein n=1 Tax=Canavalia gladiata TaxID=3824 RepID=A0AAN9M280_CANGL
MGIASWTKLQEAISRDSQQRESPKIRMNKVLVKKKILKLICMPSRAKASKVIHREILFLCKNLQGLKEERSKGFRRKGESKLKGNFQRICHNFGL